MHGRAAAGTVPCICILHERHGGVISTIRTWSAGTLPASAYAYNRLLMDWNL